MEVISTNSKLAIVVVFALFILLGAAFAQIIANINNTGNITVIGSIDYSVDGELNPTTLTWGDMVPGTTYLANLSVTSKYNTNIRVTITTPGLPEGWTHSWPLNLTVWGHYETKFADYELTPSSTATAGSYEWQITITAMEV